MAKHSLRRILSKGWASRKGKYGNWLIAILKSDPQNSTMR